MKAASYNSYDVYFVEQGFPSLKTTNNGENGFLIQKSQKSHCNEHRAWKFENIRPFL